jgi:hypothetical protein
MANHTKFLNLAKRLIAKHGRLIELVRIDSPAPDPDKPWNGPVGGPTDVSLATTMGVMVPFRGNDFGSLWEDFDLSKVSDEILLVAGMPGIDLLQAHKIKDSGDRKIEWVQHLKPGDLTLMYAFGVNR